MRYIISPVIASLLAGGAWAEVPLVVTDIPPVHSLVAQVMGDLGTPELLLAKGADEHDFQLRPSQAGALNAADVVFWVGPSLTPWLERALEGVPASVGQVALLDAAVEKMTYAEEAGHDAHGSEEHGHDEGAEAHADEHGEEHAGEHGEEHAGEHGEEEHDHSGTDPHAWLSPENATAWVGVIAADLSQRDPDNAATYAANAAAAVQAIAAADAATKAALAPVADKPFVVFHDAYRYYAAHYGLTIAGTLSEGDAAAPGAARLVELQQVVASGGAVCLFPEVQHDPAQIAQIAEGSAARVGGALDPVGSSYDPGPGMYGALLTGMAGTIASCLSGE